MEKTEQEIRSEAEEILGKAIQTVVFQYNAYAPIISSFRVVYSEMIPTMGVDRYARLVVNPKFLVENRACAQGLVIHETLHIFMGHTSDKREKLAYTDDLKHNELVNIAEDCAINQFIRESLPKGAITPSVLSEMLGRFVPFNESAEYYYELIMNNQKKKKSGQGNSNGREDKEQFNNPCATDIVNSKEIQDKLEQMGIKHISAEEINDKAMDVAKQIAKSQGHQYGGLVDFAKKMLEPKVDWRPLLQATVRNAEKKVWSMRCKNTYKRISKRSTQVLLPKKYGNKITVTLSFDTSGSIDHDMVSQFLSEIQGCMKLSELKECALWHTDNYWYGTPIELQQNIEKVFQSGGTDENCMVNAEEHCLADLHIHFSDGYHGQPAFKRPEKNIEIVWDGKDIKEIRKFN